MDPAKEKKVNGKAQSKVIKVKINHT